jgi:hypothetical protein
MTRCEAIRALSQRCRRSLRRNPAELVIDLRAVRAADTKLAACLVSVYRAARASAARLEILPSPAVVNVLTVCRLQRLIDGARPSDHALM